MGADVGAGFGAQEAGKVRVGAKEGDLWGATSGGGEVGEIGAAARVGDEEALGVVREEARAGSGVLEEG